MPSAVTLFAEISRSEFLLPNLGSLIMGLAWGAHPPVDPGRGAVAVVLSFLITNLSSLIGAQVNTLYDYQLDLRDARKKDLVQALDAFGHAKVRVFVVLELAVTLVLVSAFAVYQQTPFLLILWLVGIALGIAFSAPPLRLKARYWIGPVCQMLVLAVSPVLFAYYAFTTVLNAYFLMALAGLSLTVYGVIVPTEIRDYFGDRAMGIQTLTVRLGLSRAAEMGLGLLSVGAALTGVALLLEWAQNERAIFGLCVLAILLAAGFVLSKLWRLYGLTRTYEKAPSQDRPTVEAEIAALSSGNPTWIMVITQTYSALSILLLLTKFVL